MNLRKVIVTLIVVSMAVVCFGCGNDKTKKEETKVTTKETTEETTVEPTTEPVARIPLIPIKGIKKIKWGMTEDEVKKALTNDKLFNYDKGTYILKTPNMKKELNTIFKYDDNGFLNEIEMECYGDKDIFFECEEKFEKIYPIKTKRTETNKGPIYSVARGFGTKTLKIAVMYIDDEFKLSFARIDA